jgi:hypothetical protein
MTRRDVLAEVFWAITFHVAASIGHLVENAINRWDHRRATHVGR